MPDIKHVPVLWMVVLVLATSCASTGRTPEAKYSPDHLIMISEKFLAAGDVAQAIKYLTLAEKKRPKDPQIQYYLGLAFEVRGLPDDALKHFDKALALKPDYSEVYNNLGSFYAEKGDYTKAEEYFHKALENPTYETPFYGFFNLGQVAEKKGDYQEALKEYDQAIRLLPSYGMAFYRKGLVLEELHRTDEAKEAYSQAVLYAPDLADAHLHFGILCYGAGEIENALYSFSKVIKLSPHSPAASEAKRYLERMQGIFTAEGTKSSPPMTSDRLSQVEVAADREELDHAQSAASKTTESNSREKVARAQRNLKAAGLDMEIKEPERDMGRAGSSAFIVQVGSFRDKENADKLCERLTSRGYDAVVRGFSHQTLGRMFVVQLKSVDTSTKANTLMDQIEKEAQLKPIVIKVPVNP